MSTESRAALYPAVIEQIRHFIAGTILFNQKVADRVGLHLTDMQCINVLEMVGPATPGELARQTGLTTGGVTVMLDRLEKAGYVKREPNPNDRRSVLVRINPRKIEKVDQYYGEINRRMAGILDATSEADLKTVLAFFARMNKVRVEEPIGQPKAKAKSTRRG